MKYCRGTFSGYKATLCTEEITMVRHQCTFKGQLPNPTQVKKIVNWGLCGDLSDVWAFLGTMGVVQIFIQNFAHQVHHLVILACKDSPFIFRPEQIRAQEDLKQALLNSTAFWPLNYSSNLPVILAVDTSHIVVGFYLCQYDEKQPQKRYFSWFCSITLHDWESHFSQLKLKLYG